VAAAALAACLAWTAAPARADIVSLSDLNSTATIDTGSFFGLFDWSGIGGARCGSCGRVIRDAGTAVIHAALFGKLAQAFFFLLFLFRQVSLAFFELVVWFGQDITFDHGRADRSGEEIEWARSYPLAANANDDPPSPPAGGQDGPETGYNLIAVAAAAAATATAAATTTSTATAAPAAAATTTTAAAAIFLRTGFVYGQAAAVDALAVERFDGGLRLRFRAHLDEAEALGAAGIAVRDHLHRRHRAMRGEHLFKVVLLDVVAQIAYIKLLAQ
jgi:hypothetical protein